MSRLFIIGAGFSKAIANAPLANDLIKCVWEKSSSDNIKYNNFGIWHDDSEAFRKLLKFFHNTIQDLVNWLEKQDDRKILNSDFKNFLYSLNIEFVCSYLDLLIKHYFIPKVKGVDMSGCPIPFINGFHKMELISALRFINHYILDLLLMDNLSVKTDTFEKMSMYFREGDNFISFNYDLIIEQMLWKRKLWSPFDGYGFEFDKKGNEHVHISKTKIIKIHGSINWRSPDIFFHPKLELAIDHPFKNEPLFEGLNIPKTVRDKLKYPTYPLNSHIIIPTFIKSPQYNWEMKLIETSRKFCMESDEIFILGYSAPESDYITNLLFSAINKHAKIYIVLWGTSEDVIRNLKNSLVKKYELKLDNIIAEYNKIENWIDNNFQYLSYQKYLEEQKVIKEIINYSKKKRRKYV